MSDEQQQARQGTRVDLGDDFYAEIAHSADKTRLALMWNDGCGTSTNLTPEQAEAIADALRPEQPSPSPQPSVPERHVAREHTEAPDDPVDRGIGSSASAQGENR